MTIVDFTYNHIEQAMQLAKANYEEERSFVPILPQVESFPVLNQFADNKLGVVSFENGQMTGFLCCLSPWENAFGTTGIKGTFSPIHAHGAIQKDRKRTYSNLYREAAEKWVSNGIISHSMGLYAHDKAAVDSFFNNGFGLRCVDGIRSLDNISIVGNLKCDFVELKTEEIILILPLHNLLVEHFRKSPIFMYRLPLSEEQFLIDSAKEKARFFVAKIDNEIVAYIKIGESGENFVCDDKLMMNVSGAYCHPKYRGTGIYNDLLSHLIKTLNSEGYALLGVDFESFNYTANGFWLKYFTSYTSGVVRRVDELILNGLK